VEEHPTNLLANAERIGQSRFQFATQLGIFKPLDFGLVRFYGKISYSFYLPHMLAMLFADRLLNLAGVSLSNLPVSVGTITLTVLSVMVTTPAAYLSWRLIEIPALILAGAGFRSEKTLAPSRDFAMEKSVETPLQIGKQSKL
jgi:peptidoglycan/LPS O-acetylase OafA/YrhL